MQEVLVIGFGAAGAAAAIAAHDAGARVRILEKGARGGGNCLYSGGFLCETDSVDHLDALCFAKTPRDVLEAFAAGLGELPGWLEDLGGAVPVIDWPPSWPHLPGAVTYRRFAAERPGPAVSTRSRSSRRCTPSRPGRPWPPPPAARAATRGLAWCAPTARRFPASTPRAGPARCGAT